MLIFISNYLLTEMVVIFKWTNNKLLNLNEIITKCWSAQHFVYTYIWFANQCCIFRVFLQISFCQYISLKRWFSIYYELHILFLSLMILRLCLLSYYHYNDQCHMLFSSVTNVLWIFFSFCSFIMILLQWTELIKHLHRKERLSCDIGVANCTLYTIFCGSVAGIF